MKKNWIGVLIILGLAIGVGVYLWADFPGENIAPTDKWAWGENIGWHNFDDANGGVVVADNGLAGWVWHENVGWIKLDYDGIAGATNTNETNWGVTNDGSGNLSGYAWGENVGWINFNPTHSQVTIDSSGNFSGYAWSENVGWINFAGTAINNDTYKVKTSWTPDTTAAGGGGIDHHHSWYECAIATSAYSRCTDGHRLLTDSHRSQITTLCKFRDECLLTNPLGRAFVRLYYQTSPKVADFIRDKEALKAITRTGLKPLVWVAEKVTN